MSERMAESSFFNPAIGGGALQPAEVEAITRELEELATRMEAQVRETGTISTDDAQCVNELSLRVKRFLGTYGDERQH
jgi:hypothetical protein